MDSCVTCFKVATDSLDCVYIESDEWNKCNVRRIIEKHLWWWYLKHSSSYICRQCWKMLASFHAFYLEVEEIHKQFDAEECSVFKCSIVKEEYDLFENNHQIKGSEAKQLHDNFNEIKICNDNNKKSESQLEMTREYDEYLAQSDYQLFCNLCNTALISFSDLESHYRQEHNITGYAMCCNEKFYNGGPFADHLRVHENPNYFKCTICSLVLSQRLCYEQHLKNHKRSSKQIFICDKCNTSFVQKSDYDEHILFHNICRNNIKKEELSVAASSESMTCSGNVDNKFCNFFNGERSDMVGPDHDLKNTSQNYLINVSPKTEAADLESATCYENVKNNDAQAHVNETSKNAFQNLSINVFENTEEINVKPVVKTEIICSEYDEQMIQNTRACDKNGEPSINFVSQQVRKLKKPKNTKKQNCKNVQVKGKGKKDKRKPSDILKSKEDEDYLAQSKYAVSCQLCEISLTSFIELKTHYRIVHNVNGYVLCCKKKLYNRGQFADHLRVHENPNYFKCKFCSRVLSHRLSYENHLKCHKRSSNQFFVCDICEKCFFKRRDFVMHTLSHNQDVKRKSECTNIRPNNSKIFNEIETETHPSVSNSESKKFSENDDENFEKDFIDKRIEYTDSVSQKTETKELLSVAKSESIACSQNDVQTIQKNLNNQKIYCSDSDAQCQPHELFTEADRNFCNNFVDNTENSGIISIVKTENAVCFEYDEQMFQNRVKEEEPSINDILSQDKILKKPTKMERKISKNARIKLKKYSKDPSDIQQKQDDEEYLAKSKYTVSCQLCDFSFTRFFELKTHYRLEHDVVGFAMCCNKKFYNRRAFADHLRIHENPNYFKCKFCGRVLAHRVSYKNHIEFHKITNNTRERMFDCEKCDSSFYSKAHFKKHMLRHLPDEDRKIECDECGKKFAAAYLVKQHKANIHLKRYKKICEICGKILYNRATLKNHMDRHKGLSSKLPCGLCDKTFSGKFALQRHEKVVHNEEIHKEHVCSFCSKVSPNLKDHNQHIMHNHTKERKHACHLCEKKFTRPVDLREHLSTHTGVPLIPCPHCYREFNNRSTMHSHRQRSHPKEVEEGKFKKLASQKLRHKKTTDEISNAS